MADGSVSPVPANVGPPHPGSPEGLAANLSDVLRAVPLLHHAPNVALTVAKAGGNVHANAQAVGAVAHVRALDQAAQELHRGVRSYDFVNGRQVPTYEAARTQGMNPLGGIASGAGGLLGEVGKGITRAEHAAKGNISTEAPSQAVSQALTGTAPNPSRAIGAAAAGQPAPAPTRPAPGAATIGAMVQPALQQAIAPAVEGLNPITLMTTPQHLYRTWEDIYVRHGPTAMVEAMIPSLIGAGTGFFLTHGGAGTEEGAATGEDLALQALGDTAAPTDVLKAANSAQRTGQAFRTAAKAAATPVAQAIGAPIRAGTAIGTSPAFLGANVGGLSTRAIDPIFEDSWNRTANGSPRGEIGSFGRLLATGLSNIGVPGFEAPSKTNPHGSMLFNAVSGSLDAFSNIAILDPLGAAGRVVGQARSAEGLGGPLGHFYGGTAIQSPEDVDRILKQYPAARAFVADVVDKNGGAILNKYGAVTVPPLLAARLGNASSEDAVVNVLKDMAHSMDLATTTGKMPTLTAYTKLKDLGAQTKIGAALTTPSPTAYMDELKQFSGREFIPGDPNAVEMIMHVARASGVRPNVVADLGTYLLETSDPRRWQNTLENLAQTMLGGQVRRALGQGPLTEEMTQSINRAAEETFGGRGAGFVGQFGTDANGTNLSKVRSALDEANQSRAAAIFFTQQGKMVVPQIRDMQRTAKEIADAVKWSSAKGVYAKGQNLRDFLDDVVNHKFFQPLALATGGWALRVSSSEMLLNALRQGPLNLSAARIATSAAKHNLAIGRIEMDPNVLAEMDRLDAVLQKGIQSSTAKNYAARAGQNLTRHLIASVRGTLAGIDEAAIAGLGKQRILDAATKLSLLHDGFLPGAISATHNLPLVGQDEVSRKVTDIRRWMDDPQFGGQGSTARKIRATQLGPDWSQLAPTASGYFGAWAAHTGLISADTRFGQPLARAYLDHLNSGMSEGDAFDATIKDGVRILQGIPNQERNYMLRNVAMEPGSVRPTPLEDWSEKGVRAIRGVAQGEYGPLHSEVLSDIANQTVPPTAKAMMEKYASKASEHYLPPDHLPVNIPGQAPIVGHGQLLQRVASQLHTKFFSKIVNYLSREPTFVVDFANESKLLEHQVKAGVITQDQADVVAQTRAIFKSIRFVHNPQDRMRIEQELHVVAPFWFAKNQAIRRAGRLFATNPGALEQYLKLNLAVQNISYQATQNNGQSSFIVPGSAFTGSAMTGLFAKLTGQFPEGSIPIALSGSTDTMQTMVPWSGNGEASPGSPMSIEQTLLSPALGPLGAVPMRAVQDFTTGHVHDLAAQALGPVGSTTPWWTYALPNSIAQHFAEWVAFVGHSNDLGTSANTAFLGAIASYADSSQAGKSMGTITPSDLAPSTAQAATELKPGTEAANTVQQAKLIKQISNTMKVLLLARLVATGMSPVSLSLSRADLKFTQEVQTYITNAHGNVIAGVDKFMKDNPNAVASTVYSTISDVGSGWGETAKDGQWIKDNSYAVGQYPNAAQYLVPPSANKGPFAEATHLMEMAEGLRHEQTPAEFLKNIYIAWGNNWYYNGIKPQLDAQLKANPGNSYQIYNRVDQVIKNYGLRNPQWAEYWNEQQSTTTRSQAYVQLTQMLADPKIPKSAQTRHLEVLVQSFQAYAKDNASAGSSAARATLKGQWQQYLQSRVQEWPDVSTAAADLFAHLSPT